MNILILSAKTGAGHVKASEALKTYVESKTNDINVTIMDTFDTISPILNKLLIESYEKIIKTSPQLFKLIYNSTEKDTALMNAGTILINKASANLIPIINKHNPDLIISTHPFCTQIVSILKDKHKTELPLICVMTDFAPHKYWIQKHVDAYVVASEDMKTEMISRGVDADIIHPFGIPVNQSFLDNYDRDEVLTRYGLSTDKDILNILLMSGSFGVTNIVEIFKSLCEVNAKIQVVAVCGRNEKLYNTLLKEKSNFKQNCSIVGFSREIPHLMNSCDLLITKPGGLTTSEGLVCRIPMFVFDAIPGQEEKNAAFLESKGIAKCIGRGKHSNDILNSLLQDHNYVENMKRKYETFDKTNSCEKTYNLILDYLNNK